MTSKSVQIATSEAERAAIRELVDRLENGVIGQDDRDAAAALLRRIVGQKSDGSKIGRGRIPKESVHLDPAKAPLVSGIPVEIARVVHGQIFENAVQDAANAQGISERQMAKNHAVFRTDIEKLGVGWQARTHEEKQRALQTFLDVLEHPEKIDCFVFVNWASSCGVQKALDGHGIGREQRLEAIGFADFAALEKNVIDSVVAWALNSAYPQGASRKKLREDAELLAYANAFGVLAHLAPKNS